MAKGQMRSTKEARKPKKDKAITTVATRSPTASALAAQPAPGQHGQPPGKSAR